MSTSGMGRIMGETIRVKYATKDNKMGRLFVGTLGAEQVADAPVSPTLGLCWH